MFRVLTRGVRGVGGGGGGGGGGGEVLLLVSVGGGQRGASGLLIAGAQLGQLGEVGGVRAETGVGRLGSQGLAGVRAHQPARDPGGVSLAAPVLRHPQSLVERHPLVALHALHLLDVDLGGHRGHAVVAGRGDGQRVTFISAIKQPCSWCCCWGSYLC